MKPGPLPVIRPPEFSIRNILLLITAGLTIVIALLATRDLVSDAQRVTRAHQLRDAITLSDRLFVVAENVATERDLALSMLHASDADTLAALQPRLEDSRGLADSSMRAAFEALNRYKLPQLDASHHQLEVSYEAVRALRPRIDRALTLPRRQRDLALAGQWERATGQLVANADNLWTAFIRPFTDFDAVATQHLRYRHFLRTITDYNGRERSIIGQILSENSDPTLTQTSDLLRGQGVLDSSWQSALLVAQQSDLYPAVSRYFSDASSQYATLHDMTREMFDVPGAHHGGVYPISADLWFELSGQAADSLAALREASRRATYAYLDRLISNSERAIAVQAAIFLVALLLCAGSFWVIIVWAIRPINQIVDALTKATKGETPDFTPVARGAAEIGKLAAVLQAFQNNLEEIRHKAEELDASSSAMEAEVGVRRDAEEKARTQLARLALLHQISRAIGERQDLGSIYRVAVEDLEKKLPADFACILTFDPHQGDFRVARIGLRSAPRAALMAMPENTRIPVDANGLSKCLAGRLVYEPDLSAVEFLFPRRLIAGGLFSFVAAPLQVESSVFGALVVARAKTEAFSSGECEFLRQLSEHVALAAHQAQLNTALQRAYDDLRQTQEAVMQQERLRVLGQMASGIAHDINNALSPIALYTESLLVTEPALTDAGRGKLEIVQRAIDDAAHTIARMSEFYRQRDAQLTLAPVDPNVVLQQVLDLTKARWRDMAQQRGQIFDMRAEFMNNPSPILGVESELREALTNLVINAIDAMPNGGAITLRTSEARGADSPSRVQIEVIDTGVGMDEDTRQRCLEPFFTTKGERGTGLGLAMVYGAVKRHGAEIEIESAPGRGTTFRLMFSAPTASGGAGVRDLTAKPTLRLRLLIIDDDPILLRSLREVLEMDGHIVASASEGAAGVAVLEASTHSGKHFDAVITDLGMPGLDGRRVASAVKHVSPSTPVILLTGWGERMKAEDEKPENVDRVLSKPPKLQDLRAALSECCLRELKMRSA